MATPPMVPAGWYADPAGRHEYRYWDGTYWTAGVANGGITATDPLEAPPPPVQQAAGGFAATQPAAGFTPVQQPAAGFTPAQQSAAGFTPVQQPAASFTPVQPGQAGTPAVPPLPGELSSVPPLPAGFTPAGTGAPPATERRRRRWVLPAAIVTVVAVGLVAGLVIWAPWQSPPLLRPTGLAAGTPTTSSVAFHWANPRTGPPPDKYLILNDGKVIGSVPGTVTAYRTAGLAPDTAYQYRVVAERGGKRSAQSTILVVRTAIPPVSAARWYGPWTVNAKITRGSGTIHGAKKWTDTWLAGPRCTAGPCTVRLSVQMNGHTFKVTMARSGEVYRGQARTHVFPCGSGANSFPIRSTLRIRITLTAAQVEGRAWMATAWGGTMVVVSPYTASGNYYCSAASQTIALAGSP